MENIDLTQAAIIVIVIAAAIVVVVALVKGRGVKVRWGDKGVETVAEGGIEQSVTASGVDSTTKDVKMSADGTAKAKMRVHADEGATVEGVDLKAGKDSGQDAK